MPASKPDHYSKLAKYAACGDHDSGSRYAKDLDDDSRAAVSARLDDEGDEDIKMRLQKYMAIPDHDGDESATVRQYRRERNSYRERYRKEKAGHEALRKRYAKLKADHDTLAKKERRAVRYAKLTELNQDGYSFDPDEEADDCESMDNAQFERHVQRIQQRYQRIPLGGIPIPRSPMRDGVSTDEKRQRYAKQASANVQAARARGEKIEYKQELERLLAADGKPDKAA